MHRHWPALDGLRGIAILLVLAHAFSVFEPASTLATLLKLGFDFGWIGVQLFFVLSGFLITGILLDARDSAGYYRNFIARRALRIFPLYYGVLLVAFVVLPLLRTMPAGYGEHQAWLWLYVANFTAPFGRSEAAFPHFWSLCVEEQFYLLWPWLVRWVGRRGVLVSGGVLVVLAIASRVLARALFPSPLGEDIAYMFTICRFDALAIGAMLAALLRDPRALAGLGAKPAAGLAATGAALVLVTAVFGALQRQGQWMQWIGYTTIALGFACVLAGALNASTLWARLLSLPWLRRCGQYSYGMYVFHAPLHVFVGLPLLAALGLGGGILASLGYFVIATVATFIAGALSYMLYERHLLPIKARSAPKPAASPLSA